MAEPQTPAQKITENQHFVPRFYLKTFASEKGFIEVLDISNRRMGKARPYASVCYEKFFYGVETGKQDEVSQIVEKMFGDFENTIAKDWPEILTAARSNRLRNEHLDALAYLLSMLWMRTPNFRRQMNNMSDQLYRHLLSFSASSPAFEKNVQKIEEERGAKLSEEEKRKIRESIEQGKYELEFNNSQHLTMLKDIPGFHNLFFYKKWNVLKASGVSQFITSDDPVVEWMPKRKSFYGHTFLERSHYLTIAPDLMLELLLPEVEPEQNDPEKFIEYKMLDEDEIKMYNILVAEFSGKFAYAQDRRPLGHLLTQLKKPDKAMLLYYKKFKEPLS